MRRLLSFLFVDCSVQIRCNGRSWTHRISIACILLSRSRRLTHHASHHDARWMGPTEPSILVHLLVQRDHRTSENSKRRLFSFDKSGLAPPSMRARTVPPASQRHPVHWWPAGQSVGRANRTRSALPSATTSFACCEVVIIPTMPTRMSGCAFLIASANGTCEESENGCYHVIVSPVCVSPYLVPRPDRNLLSHPVSPGAHIVQVNPELLQLSG